MLNMSIKARLLSHHSYNVPGKLRVTEYFFEVPRDYSSPSSPSKLTLFARAARRLHSPADTSQSSHTAPLPYLLYLQGGPGFGCASPQHNGWTNTFLDRGYQVLCLDQRGTGLSSPLSASSLQLRGDEEVQANYLRSFRADSIVADCEAVRACLTDGLPEAQRKWTLMGQSYGGFVISTYLSFAAAGVREAFVLGGLPPITHSGPDDVYSRLVKRVIRRNEAYYAKFPDDLGRVRRIVNFLVRYGNTGVKDTSDLGFLTARRFLGLGLYFGFHGGLDVVHDIVLRADNDLTLFGHITRPTISKVEQQLPYNDALVYSILHESIYCQNTASKWSASRAISSHAPLFDIPSASPLSSDSQTPIYFTGEMIFPWMFEDYAELRPLRKQAELIAQYRDWSALYDLERLRVNTVPIYAAVFMDDMYVDYDLSMDTASRIGNVKTFITNGMYHDAIRSRMDDVLKGLFALRDDVLD